MGRYEAGEPPPDSPRAKEIEADAADPRNGVRAEIWLLGIVAAIGAALARNEDMRRMAGETIRALKHMAGF